MKSRYFQGNLLRISYLQIESSSLIQGDFIIVEFFTKLHVMWDELDNFKSNLVCTCFTICT